MFCCSCLFFFFKQKTAYEMRISDWSSDVCSSDLLLAVGVVASLYAGYLAPEFRVTASQLSALINGFATILLFAFIDPQLSVMTDDAVECKVDEAVFRRAITLISLSRLAGTILARALFIPATALIRSEVRRVGKRGCRNGR